MEVKEQIYVNAWDARKKNARNNTTFESDNMFSGKKKSNKPAETC